MKYIIFIILIFTLPLLSYENLTPAQVHSRLAAGDSLQLLDVREVSEYKDGHMAEPSGMPIVVPANMPWSSGVLNENYDKLPKDIDIIVNCRSGGRSAAASAFLESKGFTRIFNMTSGFNGWSYDSRKGLYGDGSGAWVGTEPMTINCSQEPDIAQLIFVDGGAFPDAPQYVELHKVLSVNAPFENLAENAFLYYTIVFDKFGLPVFKNYLQVGASVELGVQLGETQAKVSFFFPNNEWQGGDEYVSGNCGFGGIGIFRWCLVEPKVSDQIVTQAQPTTYSIIKAYPNPFNGQLLIDAPSGSAISIYDIRGRFITTVQNNRWHPAAHIGSGLYVVQVKYQDIMEWNKVVYQK